MRDRLRWQPEEDALLRAYVDRFGPREWSLLPQRMGLASFHRDPKSCLERWKNYLRPGLKKGSLTQEEQSLVVSLQAKHGNKWKLIASHLPGRTPKRLGKWWEVFKEKQAKKQQKRSLNYSQGARQQLQGDGGRLVRPQQGKYDHILETFADKYVLKGGTAPAMLPELSLGGGDGSGDGCVPPILSLAPIGSSSSSSSSSSCNVSGCSHGGNAYSPHPLHHHMLPPVSKAIPPWMSSSSSTSSMPPPPSSTLSSTTAVAGAGHSPSVGLALFPSEQPSPAVPPVQHLAALSQLCRELEEGRQSWMQHKKEANWRLSRLEQQLESEKARKKREKEEEVEAKIRALREEETSCLDRIDVECREQLCAIQKDAEAKEAKMVEMWATKQAKLARVLGQVGSTSSAGHYHGQNYNHEYLR